MGAKLLASAEVGHDGSPEALRGASAVRAQPSLDPALLSSTTNVLASYSNGLVSGKYADPIDVENEQAMLMQALSAPSSDWNSGRIKIDKTWDAEDTNGQTTVTFSISASEGRNIILRNMVGKIAANLALRMSVWKDSEEPPATPMQIIDGFADEGHRVGAFYLMRALSVAFYLALPPPIALKLSSDWIKKMNAHKSAENVDIFDEGQPMPEAWGLGTGKVDLFELLSEHDRQRSEIQFVRFFHGLFPVLNAFTLPIDFLFNHVLTMPVLEPKTEAAFVAKVHELLQTHGANRHAMLEDDAAMAELLGMVGAKDMRVLTGHLLPSALLLLDQAQGSGEKALEALHSDPTTLHHLWKLALSPEPPPSYSPEGGSAAAAPRSSDGAPSTSALGEEETASSKALRAAGSATSFALKLAKKAPPSTTVGSKMLGTYTPFVPKAAPAAMSDRNAYVMPSSKLRANAESDTTDHFLKTVGSEPATPVQKSASPGGPADDELLINFFHPRFVSLFGSVLFGFAKGATKANGDRRTPVNAAAFVHSIQEMAKNRADPLSSDAYYDLVPTLDAIHKVALLDATQLRYFAFDHVATTAAVDVKGQTAIRAVYMARGRPDKWQPWTKADHRRKVKPGVWVCKKPQNNSDEAWWRARRKIGLLESVVSGKRDRVRVFWYHAPDDVQDRALPGKFQKLVVAASAPSDMNRLLDEGTVEAPGAHEEGLWYGANAADVAADNMARHIAVLEAAAMYHAPDDVQGRASSMQGDGNLMEERSYEESLATLQVLNLHLGKAGGLNFGLEGLLRLGIVPPSETFPMMFSIIDARHACDARWWTRVLPAFYFLEGDADEKVSFDLDIALCQIPHSYIGAKADKDKLDMRNDFLFSGMAITRDRSYGMTSCGTGGIWAITSAAGAGEYFYGRTMIEDTSTSHLRFLEGKRSVYLPPKRATDDQLMRAVPKLSANYLEALERWDTGAVQILFSMSMTYLRFWLALFVLLLLCLAVLAPMKMEYRFFDLYYKATDQSDQVASVVTAYKGDAYFQDLIILGSSASVLLGIFGSAAILSYVDARSLNNLLRYLVITFNSIYPFNAFASLFWLAMPPWLCFTVEFPFALEVNAAVIGSLVLMVLQFLMVAKMKKDAETQGAELDEVSIFRSQQLDLVTVPIKIRAIFKGFSTAWRDVFGYHDNSWWESFGAGHTKAWVQCWLLFVFCTMLLSIIAGPARVIMAAVQGAPYDDMLFPVGFGAIQALVNMWVISSPLWYMIKDAKERPKPSLRYINLAVLLVVAAAVFVVLNPEYLNLELS